MPVRGRGVDLDNMSVAETQIAASVNIVATSSATGTVAMTLGPFTLEGPKTVYVETFAPQLTKGTTNIDMEWWLDGAPGTGTIFSTASGHLAANIVSWYNVVRGSLTSGNHTLRLAGFVDAGTGVVVAGAGTATGNNPNAWARVWVA